jgi:hypothetical protein
MGDILKEAIADAKAVRETALQNAKMALEEAFTPQLKSMLSAKLKEDEMGDEEEVAVDDEEEVPAEEAYVAEEDEEEFGDEEELGGDEEEVPAEEGSYSEDEEMGDEEMGDDEEMEEEALDLEAVIRELESEISEGEEGEEEGDDEVEVDESIFTEEEGEDDEEEPVEEQSETSGIGAGDNKVNVADGSDEEDPEGGPGTEVRSMGESLYAELQEYKEAVHFLKDKLHEVNILNAKLLFTNKLFKQYSLNNNQKLKVVETFDRAQTTREIKLVYSTLAEQFGDNSTIVTKKSISESASAAVSSTKPSKESRKVISEETQVANRFKKLAGLIK